MEYIINKYYKIACKTTPTLRRKHVTPHTMRHTKACHFLINGVALPVIQKFLGHSSVQTTEIYLDITSGALIKAVNDASTMILSENDLSIKPKWNDNEIMNKLNKIFAGEA